MSKTYTATGKSISGLPLTVTFTDTRTTGSDTLIAENRFLSLEAGRNDHVRIEPMWPKELTLSAVRTAPVEDLTDAAEDEVLASVTRDDTSEEVQRGYFVPRRYEDQPFLPHNDVVSLTADEGLPTLKSKTVDEASFSGDFQVRILDVIRELLNGLYGTSLPIEIGMRWWPKSSALTSSDCPLRYTWLDPDNFREDRPDGDEWISQFDALKAIFQAFGFVCRQTLRGGELRWHIRSPFALNSNHEIPLWLVQPGGSINYLGETDLSLDLSQRISNGDLRRDHARTFEEGRQRVQVAHDHARDLNYIREPGFEEVGFYWNNIAAGADFNQHAIDARTPDSSVENQRFCLINYNSDSGDGSINYQLEQSFSVVLPDKKSSLRLQWEQWTDVPARLAIELTDGTLTLGLDEAKITSTLVEAGEKRINTAPLPDTLYEGQRVPVFFDSGPWVPGGLRTYLEVGETSEKGDTVVRGTLPEKIESGNYIAVPTFQSNPVENYLPVNRLIPDKEDKSWGQEQVQFSLTDDNGSAVDSDSLTIRFGFKEVELDEGVIEWLFDNITLEPRRDGSSLSQTTSIAETDDTGEEDEIETRVGSGPSEENIGRIYGQGFYDYRFSALSFSKNGFITVEGDATVLDGTNVFVRKAGINNGEFGVQSVSYDSTNDETELDVIGLQLKDAGAGGFVVKGLQSQFNAFRWGVGPSASNTYPLGELLARQRLRHFRGQNETLQIEPVPTDDPLFFHGHEVVVIDGTAHTISEAQATPSQGTRPITLLELTDYGTS